MCKTDTENVKVLKNPDNKTIAKYTVSSKSITVISHQCNITYIFHY